MRLGPSPCFLAFVSLLAVLAAADIFCCSGACNAAALAPSYSRPVPNPCVECSGECFLDAETTQENETPRHAKKTPPVVKSQSTMTPDIARPAAPPAARSLDSASLAEPRALLRSHSRDTSSSEPSESLLS